MAEEYISKLPLHEQLAARKTLQLSTSSRKRKTATATATKSNNKNGSTATVDDNFGADDSDSHDSIPAAKKMKNEEPEHARSASNNSPKKIAKIPEPEIPIQRGKKKWL